MRVLGRRQLILATLRLQSLILTGRPLSSSAFSLQMSSSTQMKTIDSHLHVWANPSEAKQYPYFPTQEPPPNLATKAATMELLESMTQSNVQGSLIVQPINHKFDHSYVAAAIKAHPDKFKGMMLHDPSLPLNEALGKLEEMKSLGFVGVRYNPYLWPEGELMSNDVGSEVFKR